MSTSFEYESRRITLQPINDAGEENQFVVFDVTSSSLPKLILNYYDAPCIFKIEQVILAKNEVVAYVLSDESGECFEVPHRDADVYGFWLYDLQRWIAWDGQRQLLAPNPQDGDPRNNRLCEMIVSMGCFEKK